MKPDFKSDKYHIYLGDDDFIHSIPMGSFETAEEIRDYGEMLRSCAKVLVGQHKPVILLYDMSQTGKTNGESRKAMIDFFKTFEFDEMAMFGMSFIQLTLAKFFANLLPQMAKVRVFNSEKEAVDYLNGRRSAKQSV